MNQTADTAGVAMGKCEPLEMIYMVNITLVELHLDEGSLSANLPFSGFSDDEEEEFTAEETTEAEDSSGGKGLALLGVLVLLIAGAAAVKYATGADEPEPDVQVDTADEESMDISA